MRQYGAGNSRLDSRRQEPVSNGKMSRERMINS